MGAQLAPGGATFRVWAPGAQWVHLVSDLSGWNPTIENALTRDPQGYWAGFWPGFVEGSAYKFYVVGLGSSGYNRDPYARELTDDPPFPYANCVVRDPRLYPWHDRDWRPPPFHHWIIYQLHVGSFWSPGGPQERGTFLDVAEKLPYLADLGINAVQLLPIVEFNTQFSLGYNGTDYFSPENDYGVPAAELPGRLARLNELLASKQQPALELSQLDGPANQLRCLVDLAHLHGLAVIFDVVYNHAGGAWGEPGNEMGSIYFFDRRPVGDNNDSLYFTDRGHAGGLCFAMWRSEVRQFLIDNAKFLFEEYHIDGLRHDQVSVLDEENRGSGWLFCQHLTNTCHALRPESLQHAEYWPVNSWVVRGTADGGAGFDTCYHDGLREAVRGVLAAAANGADARVSLDAVRDALWPPGLSESWRGVQNLETHDEVYRDRKPRIATLADRSRPYSWYGRSRARVATGLLLTAPGIPMLFMGQEFLETQPWADDIQNHPQLRIDWAGLNRGERAMVDFHRFVRELAWLRRTYLGLTGEGYHPFYVHNDDRILAFHRWVPGSGSDVVVVASLSERTRDGYRIGFPRVGRWKEVFNSDVHDHWVNPWCQGNGGGIDAQPEPRHGLPASAELVLPANSLLVFVPLQ
ncbi:MAG: alpha amylase C-terminal domain-containing protein [Nitrospira sp.]|nr:alpha amylase C-terminal domain-containing protein [Nitrospira sp.]